MIAPDANEGFVRRVREVWQYRRILWFFARRSLESLYRRTHLGPSWMLIRTLTPLAVGSFVFGQVLNVPSNGVPYFVFFLAGQLPWNFFDSPLIRASRGLESNRQLLAKLYVPRVILPIGSMAAGLVEPVIITGVLAAALVYYRVTDDVWYVQPEMRLPAAMASVVVVLIFTIGLSLFTSVWQARARDMRFVLRYAVGFWLLLTPVVYPVSHVPERFRWLMYLNPLTAPVETFKWAVLPGMEHSWGWWLYSAAVALVMLAAGSWYFSRAEHATMDKL